MACVAMSFLWMCWIFVENELDKFYERWKAIHIAVKHRYSFLCATYSETDNPACVDIDEKELKNTAKCFKMLVGPIKPRVNNRLSHK